MSIVFDEYGNIVGIVTFTDIVQAFIGGTVTLNEEEGPIYHQESGW